MDNYKPSEDCFLCSPIVEDLLDRVLTRDTEVRVWKSCCSSLRLHYEAVPIRPDFQLLSKYLVFRTKVIHDDISFALVAIPPFVTQLGIMTWELISSKPGLAYARVSPYPDASGVSLCVLED